MKSNRKLGIILLSIVLLPAIFFSVYEIGSLNKNEEMIGEIYNSQLEVILTSVNQYSDDVAASWTFTFNNIVSSYNYPDNNISQYISNYQAIKGFFIVKDTANYKQIHLIAGSNLHNSLGQKIVISGLLKKNKLNIKRLFSYYKTAMYRKIEPLGSGDIKGLSYLVCIMKDVNGNPCLTGMIVDPRFFVRQMLAPKIQMMVRDKFIIDIRDEQNFIYSSEPLNGRPAEFAKALHLMPDVKVGIVYKGKTIQQLVRDRTYLNFGLIMFIDILFMIGTWFIYKSFKTEIQLSKMRSDFIANVSHEIRTPIALLSVYSESLLLGRYKPEKLKEYHGIIYQETNRLADIVNKILNFSKMEEKKYKYNFSNQSINELLMNVLERFNYHLNNAGFATEINLGKDIPNIEFDKEAITEVFTNLIDNAIKYSEKVKFLEVESLINKNVVTIRIKDKGIGISPEQQPYIFEKFYRGSETDVHNIKGSGLGLAIVKNIIEGHKGTINVESEPDNGTCFTISLPMIIHKKK